MNDRSGGSLRGVVVADDMDKDIVISNGTKGDICGVDCNGGGTDCVEERSKKSEGRGGWKKMARIGAPFSWRLTGMTTAVMSFKKGIKADKSKKSGRDSKPERCADDVVAKKVPGGDIPGIDGTPVDVTAKPISTSSPSHRISSSPTSSLSPRSSVLASALRSSANSTSSALCDYQEFALLPESQCGSFFCQSMPSDNSCLFSCVAWTVAPEKTSHDLRVVVKAVIRANPGIYTATLLEKEREEYMNWIMRKDAWGGFIELSIFADYFGVQFAVIDLQSSCHHIHICGSQTAAYRAYLIYNGSHYDCLYGLNLVTGGSIRIFSPGDSSACAKALRLAEVMARQRNLRAFSCASESESVMLSNQMEGSFPFSQNSPHQLDLIDNQGQICNDVIWNTKGTQSCFCQSTF